MIINQFHSGTATGDAITNQMLFIQKVLIEEGYESNIYAEHIPAELSSKIKSIDKYKGNKENFMLVHHSMGFDAFDKIISLPDKKILVYHNITPEKFFDDEGIKHYIRKGHQQVKEYKDYMLSAIADSNYNRKELLTYGYHKVDVMPVQISLKRFDNMESDAFLLESYKNTKNILFVGRVVANKCQTDIVKIFYIYNKFFNSDSKLFLVGDLSFTPYVKEVKELIKNFELDNKVILTGKVSERELKTYYELADIFLCLSEHEGFGVPLLEAMKQNVPVIAYESSAISETMGGAGILVQQKDYNLIAGLIDELLKDNKLYHDIILKQKERIEKLSCTDTKKTLLKIIENCQSKSRKTQIQLQGPFETSYSLAIVNRKLIEAMSDIETIDASIYCTEGPGDYEPLEENLKDKPKAKMLWKRSKDIPYPDITIRNMYPPRVNDVKGALNFQAFGWEETEVPKKYIKDFNKYLDGIGTTSNFVSEALINSGLSIPTKVVGNGVELVEDFANIQPYYVKTKKKNKLLHISSAFPRKGVDILVEAYYKTFTSKDDVTLIIKTFPNPHNTVELQLENLNSKYKEAPEVILINKDLSTKELNSLYKLADGYVHVARGEGFGLPVAEAMLAKVPVIVSPNTGLADFCTEETAILIDYEMECANSHLSTGNSMWAKPNEKTLCEKLWQFVYKKDVLDISTKVENAYHLISTEYTWKKVSERWMSFIEEIEESKIKNKVAMVTTWNSKCGIAEYTRFQCEAMKNTTEFHIYPNYGVELKQKDEENVKERVWHSAFEGTLDSLIHLLEREEFSIIHIQFNFGFYNLQELSKLIEKLYKNKRIIITFHKTADTDVLGKMVSLKSIVDSLNKCTLLIVHQEEDCEYLKQINIDSKIIKKVPLGQLIIKDYGKSDIRKKLKLNRSLVLGSYGFFLPHKGIYENIQAIDLLKKEREDVLYLVVCAKHEHIESQNYINKCKELVKRRNLESNVVFITDFLENEESIVLLQACDLLLMTYGETSESASGAVRFCLAARRPTITTKQNIFKEFEGITMQIERNEPLLIKEAILNMLNSDIQTQYLKSIHKYLKSTRWENVAKQFNQLYKDALK